MEQTDFTLHGARCLVIGCGRIGALLARKLHALSAYPPARRAILRASRRPACPHSIHGISPGI